MDVDIWGQLRQMGEEFTLAAVGATQQLFAPLALTPAQAGAVVERDLAYGPAGRHRLDVFRSPDARDRPVVVFVHGGGFAAGDKGAADAPFYNNVGAWAVRNGFVGVTMTYRLAPEHPWPSGAQDVERAMRWLAANIGPHGGDPHRIVLVGQSAGAAHVAGYLAGHGLDTGDGPAAIAAVMVSGLFEPDGFESIPVLEVYYGADRATYARRSAVLALAATRVPCLYTISQFDPPLFQRQLAAVFTARTAMDGHCPQVLYQHGHNHFSTCLQLGSAVDTLGEELARFVSRTAGGEPHWDRACGLQQHGRGRPAD